MTTTIITHLLGPICELYYKYKKSTDIESAEINTLRNYGFSTIFAINYGFEVFEPLDINNIQLQPGVYTYQSQYYVLPTNLSTKTNPVINTIIAQDLPVGVTSTITYINKTLPIKISLYPNSNSVLGIASNYISNGTPYDASLTTNEAIIRDFESDFSLDTTSSVLIFVNLENATFSGISTNWTLLPTSLYSYEILSYRYNNGYGQFYSTVSNAAFIPSHLIVNQNNLNKLYKVTYANVYNWINNLTWIPDFMTWFNLNKTSLPRFLKQFLADFFHLQ